MDSANNTIVPADIARYFLYRCMEDGELISPLKMQKLVYYAYVWTLINKRKHLFDEKPEAWPNGPVLPSLYQQLKRFGSSPIGEEFIGCKTENDLQKLKQTLGDFIEIIDEVYEQYITKSAFELVTMTHSEKPWKEARKGLDASEPSNNPLSDEDILVEYGNQKN